MLQVLRSSLMWHEIAAGVAVKLDVIWNAAGVAVKLDVTWNAAGVAVKLDVSWNTTAGAVKLDAAWNVAGVVVRVGCYMKCCKCCHQALYDMKCCRCCSQAWCYMNAAGVAVTLDVTWNCCRCCSQAWCDINCCGCCRQSWCDMKCCRCCNQAWCEMHEMLQVFHSSLMRPALSWWSWWPRGCSAPAWAGLLVRMGSHLSPQSPRPAPPTCSSELLCSLLHFTVLTTLLGGCWIQPPLSWWCLACPYCPYLSWWSHKTATQLPACLLLYTLSLAAVLVHCNCTFKTTLKKSNKSTPQNLSHRWISFRTGPETLEHILERCSAHSALRCQTCPQGAELNERLWGCHQDLVKTADFCLGEWASDLGSMTRENRMQRKMTWNWW